MEADEQQHQTHHISVSLRGATTKAACDFAAWLVSEGRAFSYRASRGTHVYQVHVGSVFDHATLPRQVAFWAEARSDAGAVSVRYVNPR